MSKRIIRISLDEDTDGKKLDYLMAKHLHATPQEELRHLITAGYQQETGDEMKYAPKAGTRGTSRKEQEEKITELDKLPMKELTAEIVRLGWIDEFWIDLEVKGVTIYPDFRIVKDQKVFGNRYEYTSDPEHPSWQPTMTFEEVVKDLIKKKLI